jgi:predicted SAM-dependent methyltransferase
MHYWTKAKHLGFEKMGVESKSWAQSMVDPSALVLEIGPLADPLFPKREGWNSLSVDHLETDELKSKYLDHSHIDTSKIETVDIVWTGDASELLIAAETHAGSIDAVVACHVLEHMSNPLGFMSACFELLKPNGKLLLVLPNKWFTFDYFRPASTAGELFGAFLEKRNVPSTAQIFDHLSLAVRYKDGLLDPEISRSVDNFSWAHELDEALTIARKNFETKEYIDVHAWIFTPESFSTISKIFSNLGILNFHINVVSQGPGEFYVEMEKKLESIKLNSEERFESQHGMLLCDRKSLVRFASTTEELSALSKTYYAVDVATIVEDLKKVSTEVNAMKQSLSWRITFPVRKVLDAIKGFK